MNKKVLLAYYIISTAFLLVLLGLGGYRVRAEADRNLAASLRDLEALRVSALSMALAEGGMDGQYFSTAMKKNFQSTRRLRLLAVYDQAEGFYYLLAADPEMLSALPEPGSRWPGTPRYNLRPLLHVRLSVPFNPGLRGVAALPAGLTLDGVFLRLDRQDLYPVLRELFFVVLVYLILTTILLLAAALTPPSAAPAEGRSGREPRRLPATGNTGRLPDASANLGAGSMQLDGGNPGLYSPETGLGWKDFLPQRLSQELERAASFDQDLAFMLVAVRAQRGAGAGDHRDLLLRHLGKYTLESFPLRDLGFEYDPHSVAVILPDRSLDQGLEAARMFQRKLLQSSWGPAAAVRVSIGLSSRSGRLISGTRLLIEAGRSLKKADSTGSNQIIAFRADPQKFRQVLFSGREE